DILQAADLSEAQKIALLRQWDTDLRLLMVASEENMTASAAPGRTGELLQSVHKAMMRLGCEPDLDKQAPDKTGGGGSRRPGPGPLAEPTRPSPWTSLRRWRRPWRSRRRRA